MSAKHPVIAVTGSSGAGTTTTSLAFRKIFGQLNLRAAEVEGDSFHRYTRPEMDMAIRKARDLGRHISYFGPDANDFGLLEQTFRDYGVNGKGQSRKYLHTYDEAVPWNQVPGTFTPWQPLPEPTDVLFYEGLHGGVVTPQHDVARHVDLLVGVVPIVNLEWIQSCAPWKTTSTSLRRSSPARISTSSACPPSTPQTRSQRKASHHWMKALW